MSATGKLFIKESIKETASVMGWGLLAMLATYGASLVLAPLLSWPLFTFIAEHGLVDTLFVGFVFFFTFAGLIAACEFVPYVSHRVSHGFTRKQFFWLQMVDMVLFTVVMAVVMGVLGALSSFAVPVGVLVLFLAATMWMGFALASLLFMLFVRTHWVFAIAVILAFNILGRLILGDIWLAIMPTVQFDFTVWETGVDVGGYFVEALSDGMMIGGSAPLTLAVAVGVLGVVWLAMRQMPIKAK